jgi:hypothetical protein
MPLHILEPPTIAPMIPKVTNVTNDDTIIDIILSNIFTNHADDKKGINPPTRKAIKEVAAA